MKDQLIYLILNDENDASPGILFESDIFKLQPELANLLITQWPLFAPYVTEWTIPQNDTR